MARRASQTPDSRSASDAGTGTKAKKQRWYHQIISAYRMTRADDPLVTWLMLAVFVGIVGLAVLIGVWWGPWLYTLILGLPFGLLGAVFILARRTEKVAYARIEGQPGAARAVLGTIRRGWTFDEEPVAFNARSQDLVFRGVGRPGVVLISEGPSARVAKLLDAEQKRTARALPNVPIIRIEAGNGDGQTPLRKLPRAVQRLRPRLTRTEVAEVGKRLRALDTARLPIPKGVDPLRARPDRRQLRGR